MSFNGLNVSLAPVVAPPNVAAVTAGDPLFDVAAPRVPWLRASMQAARAHVVASGLFVGLVVLNLFHLATTRLVLDRGGEEGNPVMAPIIHNVFGAFAIKVLCLALIGGLIVRSRRSARMLLVLAAVDAWYVLVIFWNLRVLHTIA